MIVTGKYKEDGENTDSLLTREESGSIKGLLIILVVLGHNDLIMKQSGWFPYLYSFHVYCFFMLPFLYGVNGSFSISWVALWHRSWRNIKKFYPVYFLFSLISLCCALLCRRVVWDALGFAYAVLWGNQFLLFRYCGFGFLWFLPTIVSVMFWRDVYFLFGKTIKCSVLAVSALLWCCAAIGLTNFHVAGLYLPFALVQGLFFCTSGIIARHVLQHMHVSIQSKLLAIVCFCCGLSFVYFRRFLPDSYSCLTWIVVPTISFCAFYQFKGEFCKCSFLKFCGKWSLQIYLLHVFVFHGVRSILPQIDSVFSGALSLFLTFVICFVCIVLIDKIKIKLLLEK